MIVNVADQSKNGQASAREIYEAAKQLRTLSASLESMLAKFQSGESKQTLPRAA